MLVTCSGRVPGLSQPTGASTRRLHTSGMPVRPVAARPARGVPVSANLARPARPLILRPPARLACSISTRGLPGACGAHPLCPTSPRRASGGLRSSAQSLPRGEPAIEAACPGQAIAALLGRPCIPQSHRRLEPVRSLGSAGSSAARVCARACALCSRPCPPRVL